MENNYIINDQDKFLEYKYKISEFYIIINGKNIEHPIKNISSFKIENHYEKATFPIFKLTISMSKSRYYDIIKNKDNVKFKLRIQGYSTENDSTNKSLVKDLINDLFIFFPEDANDDYEKTYNNNKKSDNNEELDDTDNIFEFFLFQDNIVNNVRSLYNCVLTNIDMCSTVTHLLSRAGAKNVLMSPFDNTDIYDQIIIPPQSIDKSLKYLNNNYGFHKSGTIIYFGLTNTYVLACNGMCTAYRKNEPKETVLYILDKSSNTKSLLSNTIKKHNDERNFINVQSDNIDIVSNSVSSNVIHGIDAEIINLDNTSNDSVKIDTVTVGNSNKAVIFNDTANKYMKDIYASLQQSNTITISIGLKDIDIMAFSLNKSFNVIFENVSLNMKYKGRYRIYSSIFIFSGNEDTFKVSAAITLKKVR